MSKLLREFLEESKARGTILWFNYIPRTQRNFFREGRVLDMDDEFVKIREQTIMSTDEILIRISEIHEVMVAHEHH